MKLEILTPTLALNKAYLKMSLNQGQIDSFKLNLRNLFERINDQESEEHLKNLVADFLKDNNFRGNHEINTKGRQDLAIHIDKTSSSKVGVIIEVKRPSNKSEMISNSQPNAKALHELLHYYLQERYINDNKEIKNLIITNIYDWFIFDGAEFENFFFNNKKLTKQYKEWNDGVFGVSRTDWFYQEIAHPFLEKELLKLSCTHFNLNNFKELVFSDNGKEDEKLIDLFKILSPEHLLKKPFANDSNSLNKEFYNELLYILGLAETKDKSKKLIQRADPKNRHDGSLIENTINKLESNFEELQIQNIESFGANKDEQIFSIALELCITWLNRILFLKLLEGQLKTYHPHDRNSYSFLNSDIIEEFDDLEELFFEVLAKKTNERSKSVNDKFKNIPYLNSSLFDPNEIEKQTIHISALKDRLTLHLYNHTVIKDNSIRSFGDRKTLHYLLDFLDAYDFASDGKAKIQTTQKGIINAAVLGLIFEKINGYKDGSFFTPGYITMYMCRETIRKTVVQKFNEALGINCENFNELKNYINPEIPVNRQKANEIVNSIKICDPAVGSGHFLVSALNEMIAVKSDLGILCYKNGSLIRSYNIEIINDELIILNVETEELFEYKLNQKNNKIIYLQDLQESLFHEKLTIIENCLFGVDINPKSVMICRLRLWIELLKNAYYKNDNELETLPNIDINIKCGNSLVSKFGLNSAFKQSDLKVFEEYKTAVAAYKEVTGRQDKNNLKKLIADCKNKFTGFLESESKTEKEIKTLETQIATKLSESDIFENEKSKKAKEKELQKLSVKLAELKEKAEGENNSKIYDRAFEWRFEFPEVLNEDGEYIGFDIVIGNPPYFNLAGLSEFQDIYQINFQTFTNGIDIYCLFFELAKCIGSKTALNNFIVSNKWLTAKYGLNTRVFLSKNTSNIFIIDFNKYKVFSEAVVDTCITMFSNRNGTITDFIQYDLKPTNIELELFLKDVIFKSKTIMLKNTWNISGFDKDNIRNKIELKGKLLSEWKVKYYRGITTGLNDAFVVSDEYKEYLLSQEPISSKFIEPLLRGRDIQKYYTISPNLWLINIPKGFTIKTILKQDNTDNSTNYIVSEPMPHYGFVELDPAWQYMKNNFPLLAQHLENYLEKAESRIDKGDYWWELRACAYLGEFKKEKIIFSKASKIPSFALDLNQNVLLNTSYMIIGEKLKYLVAMLNSKLMHFAFKYYYQSGGIEGEITIQAIEKLPITYPNVKEEKIVNTLVDKILEAKKKDPKADTSKLEDEIDQLVYKLYDLTEEEIAIVEGKK